MVLSKIPNIRKSSSYMTISHEFVFKLSLSAVSILWVAGRDIAGPVRNKTWVQIPGCCYLGGACWSKTLSRMEN